MKLPRSTPSNHTSRHPFSLRTLFVVTLLIAVTLPPGITHCHSVRNWVFPPEINPNLPMTADIIPLLYGRVPPSSLREITIGPVNATVSVSP